MHLDANLSHKEHVSVVVHDQTVAHLLSPPDRGVPEGLWTSLAEHEAKLTETMDIDVETVEEGQNQCEEDATKDDLGLTESASKRARSPDNSSDGEGLKAPNIPESDVQDAEMDDDEGMYLDVPNPTLVSTES